jgi:hypothetical protein
MARFSSYDARKLMIPAMIARTEPQFHCRRSAPISKATGTIRTTSVLWSAAASAEKMCGDGRRPELAEKQVTDRRQGLRLGDSSYGQHPIRHPPAHYRQIVTTLDHNVSVLAAP